MRPDLIALTLDDLTTLSNRGLVKRAQQEIAAAELTAEIQEDESGHLTLTWSDSITCQFPAQKTLSEGQCSCPATSICRHLLRSVLFYQSTATAVTTTVEATPWNPGQITDETLEKHYSKPALNKIRSQFNSGQVISIATGIKPIAHLHNLSLNLRFLVPNDLRYSHCDCNETAPCSHVPLAIWAFRQLPIGQTHSLISTAVPSTPPIALLDDLEQQLQKLAEVGIAGMNSVLRDRLLRLEKQCRQAELVWIAEILLDLLQACEYYQTHDAQFDIQQTVSYIAELLIRSDALRNHETVLNPIPKLFIQGNAQDQTVALGSSRLMGLGCGVTARTSGITITAYLQDLDSGTVMALPRYFGNPDPAHSDPKDFWQLAQASIGKGMQLGAIGAGQILMKGGKRTPGYQLIPGRSPMSLNPQSFQWEKLRSPLLVESFAELSDRLQELPIPELRPRRMTDQLQVLQISEVTEVMFDPIAQVARAIVRDASGTPATMTHPYFHRGRFGVEALMHQLQHQELRFVSAKVSRTAEGLYLEPIALIFQADGETRQILQPWIASPQAFLEIRHEFAPSDRPPNASPITRYFQDLKTALQDLWLVGFDRLDSRHLEQWQRLVREGEAIGFQALLTPIGHLSESIQGRLHRLQWDSQSAGEALAIVTVLSQVQQSLPT